MDGVRDYRLTTDFMDYTDTIKGWPQEAQKAQKKTIPAQE
jgi:hypothetical protein